MKLVRYGERGRERPGLVDREGAIRDLSKHIADIAGPALAKDSLARLATLDPKSLPVVSGKPRLGSCVGAVGHFIAIGLNYADHAAENDDPIPTEPIVFTKAPSCIVGPYDDVVIPRNSLQTDWEIELAVVIGRRASYVPKADVASVIAGYCICNDVSEREYQLERGGTWIKGKGCPTFGPLGPWLVTPDEIANVQSLGMRLWVNDELLQNGSTKNMIFDVPTIVSYVSEFMILNPGDVITTGTPAGVGIGLKPPRFLKANDVMRLEIDGLGAQRQTVVAWSAAAIV